MLRLAGRRDLRWAQMPGPARRPAERHIDPALMEGNPVWVPRLREAIVFVASVE